ncbi:WD repeat-containing protein 46-like isoform X1 [Dreissena polymorpha]|nr:WD repeat-containing protein 46-like isoform X1 [Dreissena polymorpha]
MEANVTKPFVKKKQNMKRYFMEGDGKELSTNKASKDMKKHSPEKKGSKPIGEKRFKKPIKMRTYSDKDGQQKTQQVFKIDISKTERHRKWQMKKQRQAQGEQRKLQHRKHMREQQDPFPGDAPIPKERIQKYERGEHIKDTGTRTGQGSRKLAEQEKKLQFAARQAARTEILLHEEAGFLEADEGEDTTSITQHDLAGVVDITSAQKFFELKLPDFGPYSVNYTRNGRFLLMGGVKGHVAAIDWMTKKLLCEVNVMETVNDVKWLHQETMFAVAQRQWTYMYDNQGIELHCLKKLDCVLRMEFLPFHFLLASANSKGYLSYIDVSIGEKVAGYSTQMGRLDVMCQNPSNAIVTLGHSGGTVTMWCPKLKEPVVKMLCHQSGVRSVAIEQAGQYMATSGIDRTLKIWDLRTYKMLHSYKVPMGAGQMAFSQQGLLATGMGNIVQVYKDSCRQEVKAPYLTHNLTSSVRSLQFCPYEDVLGVGHSTGFSSLIIPGAGEANFDALESNPYQTKQQRKEAEVKMLLEKIPSDMIHLDSSMIVQVDKKGLQETIEEHNKIKYLKPQKMEYEPRYKAKGKSRGQKVVQQKKGVIEEQKREIIKEALVEKQTGNRAKEVNKHRQGNVLDRFKRKVD